jgi:hypothetical protein
MFHVTGNQTKTLTLVSAEPRRAPDPLCPSWSGGLGEGMCESAEELSSCLLGLLI